MATVGSSMGWGPRTPPNNGNEYDLEAGDPMLDSSPSSSEEKGEETSEERIRDQVTAESSSV